MTALFAASLKRFYKDKVFCRRTSFTAVLGLSMSLASSVPCLAAPPQLKISGNQILAASTGCKIRLAGVDYSGLEYSPTGEGPGANVVAGIAEAITVWHANIVRLPLNQDFWFGVKNSKGSPSSAAAYQTIVQNVVNFCSSNNVYVDLDLHWSGTATTASNPPSGAGWGTAVAQTAMPDANSVTFWQSVANVYGNNPAVLFDLFNEPYPSTWAQAVTGGGGSPGLQGLLTAIRNAGANNIVIAGGIGYSYDLTGVANRPLTDTASGNGVLYAAHIYPNKGTNTPTGWDQNVGPAVKANYAVVIEEFGPDPNTCPPTSASVTFDPALITWLNGTNGENYVFSALGWNFGINDCPQMLSSWTNFSTNPHGAAVSTWLANVAMTPTPNCSGGSTSTFTPTFTSTTTKTFTSTATNTATNTFTPTNTSTKTFTLVNTPTSTSTSTNTYTPTNTATKTFTPVNTSTFTFTSTSTNTAFSTNTKTSTPVNTPTSTSTNTLTSTYTRTFTQVNTPTPTFTCTNTFTQVNTATSTWTPVLTNTPTYTLVNTSTPTFTSTKTSTPTNSFTFTFTNTYTQVNTSTDTWTPLFTNTPTFTLVNTATDTKTFTPVNNSTATNTSTWTAGWTNTSTFTSVNTATSTNTPIFSNTPSNTPSVTLSPTPTFTFTPVWTATDTRTPTNTFTATWTHTSTLTSTPTTTLTDSFTPTATFSPTPTFTATDSMTATSTATDTFTATGTYTPTKTFTPTYTWTFTHTFTPTDTFTHTNTPTQTFTPTQTYTPTSTYTQAPTPVTGHIGIYPNPAPGETVYILPPYYPGDSNVRIEIFTLGFRKVIDMTVDAVPTGTAITVRLVDRTGKPLANGLYYVIVFTDSSRTIGKLLVLK